MALLLFRCLTFVLGLSVCRSSSSPATGTYHDSNFDVVDLGYAKHAPTFVNVTTSHLRVASYNNIRFAQPPLGDLRFRKPKVPPPPSKGLQYGRLPIQDSTCVSFVPSFAPFPGVNGTGFGREDCLFLNVQVPEGVKPGDNVPVLHWLYGSAFAFGSKDALGGPWGLFEAMECTSDKFIIVASNYRYVRTVS